MLLRVHVSGCPMADMNGKYDVCTEHAKLPVIGETKGTPKKPGKEILPEFMYWHISNTTKYEFGIFLQTIPEMGYHKRVWVLARINYGEHPILYYCCEQTKGNIPPEYGWKLVGGIEPIPKITIELLDNPVIKAHPPVEVDTNQLGEALFGHANFKADNKDHGDHRNKNGNLAFQSKGMSKPKSLIQQPPCSDMKRVVDEFK